MRNFRLTHTQRLANWIGDANLQQIVDSSKDFYARIPILNTPISMFAYKGEVYDSLPNMGFFSSLFATGFSSLDDLISERTAGGKGQNIFFAKTGTLAVLGSHGSLWNVGPNPGAGGTPAAIAAGANPVNTTTGGLQQADPSGADTTHVTTAYAQGTSAPNNLLLYDRLWHGSAVQHNTTSAQTISGVVTRYTTTASVGNFAFLETTTVLGATVHNITMTYVDNAGNAAEAAAALAAVVSSAVTRLPHANWFIPLNAADTGLRNITQIQMSAASTGVSNAVVGHPIGYLPCPVANAPFLVDGINSAFNLEEIKTDACLALLEINKGAATATTYIGSVLMVSG